MVEAMAHPLELLDTSDWPLSAAEIQQIVDEFPIWYRMDALFCLNRVGSTYSTRGTAGIDLF